MTQGHYGPERVAIIKAECELVKSMPRIPVSVVSLEELNEFGPYWSDLAKAEESLDR